jgi:hypothetical protein
VGELLAGAERLAEERRRKAAKRAAAERAHREREEAEVRERYLTSLAKREVQTWSEVDALIATKQPGKYDQAVKLLCDLRDLGLYQGERMRCKRAFAAFARSTPRSRASFIG